MRILNLLIFSMLFSAGLYSQGLKGNIKDANGEPIPYATVYIKELQNGSVANTRGDYEIKLPSGKYTVIFESLGFAPDVRIISIAGNTQTLNIILQIQTYEIPEVRITASGEDPAYGIMRRVIGTAPYYLNQVSSYKAEVYLKGNLHLKKIPKIIQRQMKVEARSSNGTSVTSSTMKEGDTYMMESFNELEFNAPDTYKQHVISVQNTFPAQGSEISPMDFIQASFYEPVMNSMFISPLSPDAFFHYKFRYEGVSSQGDYYIDKIRVTPKRKSQQLFEGTIYIIEDLWCLNSVDLENENIAGKIRIQQLFIPFQENVWLPVSLKFDMNIAIIGVRGDAGYGSSIKYTDVKVNQNLKKPDGLKTISSKPVSTVEKEEVKSKTSEQIDRILAKNELSNRDMAKLSNLLTKQSKESRPDSLKNDLEIKERTSFVIEKDANRKDSAYWANIRPIPLSKEEMVSVRSADSLKSLIKRTNQPTDSVKKPGDKKNTFFREVKWTLFNHTWADTSGFSFTNGGLLNLKNLSFNTVDGPTYGIDFRLNKNWKKKYYLGIYPSFYYAFSRESFMWKVNGQLGFGKHRNQIYFRTGNISRDFNNAGGISPFINSLTTLLMEENYLKLYSGRYITVGFRTDIANGLQADFQAGFEDRKMLNNTTDFTLIKTSKDYTPNIPENEFLKSGSDPLYFPADHRHTDFSLALHYTPFEKYTIKNNTRIPRGSDWPTFSISWKHGINEYEQPSPATYQFDLLRFDVAQGRSIGAFSEFRWRFRAGTFLNKTGINFIDFNHFNSQNFPVMLKDYQDAFMLQGFYSLSTPGRFSELHVKYTTPYLLIKLLPGLSKTLMRENLSLGFLWTENHQAYTELGYSISELFLLAELGVYTGFSNFSYQSVGLKLVVKFN